MSCRKCTREPNDPEQSSYGIVMAADSTRCPPIFTIVLHWENTESEKEISETTNALEWEIDISRLYKGLEPNTKYRLVSVVGCVEEGKYICMAYKENQWVSLKHEAVAEEVVGNF